MAHFGSAGSLALIPAGETPPAYVRVELDFSNGAQLAYINRRRIGRVRLVNDVESFLSEMRIGPDALDPGFDQAQFNACLAGRKRAVKLILTDQSQISGIGNTYSDEILFHARINPATPGGDLDTRGSTRLFLFDAERGAPPLSLIRQPTIFARDFPPAFCCRTATLAVIARDAKPNSAK